MPLYGKILFLFGFKIREIKAVQLVHPRVKCEVGCHEKVFHDGSFDYLIAAHYCFQAFLALF